MTGIANFPPSHVQSKQAITVRQGKAFQSASGFHPPARRSDTCLEAAPPISTRFKPKVLEVWSGMDTPLIRRSRGWWAVDSGERTSGWHGLKIGR